MDGTGAGGADPAGSAENTATGTTTRSGSPPAPERPVRPADATGPLPVPLPADATGPLPAGALFAEPSGDRSASAAPETIGMPLVPDAAAPDVAAPDVAAPASGDGTFDVFATEPADRPAGPPTTGLPATDPTGEPPEDPSTSPNAATPTDTTGPQAFDVFATAPPTTAAATAPPATGLPTTGEPSDAPSTSPNTATPTDTTGPQAFDVFATDPPAPAPGPEPVTGLFEAVSPTTGGAPTGAGTADLFATGPAHTGAADLFTPARSAAGGLGNATGAAPGMFTPAVAPAEATGPMPLAIPPAEAPVPEPAVPPAAPPVGPRPEPRATVPEVSATETTVEAVPGTGAWAFPDGSNGDAWAFTGGERPSSREQAAPPAASTVSRPPGAAPPSAGRARKRVAWALTLVGVLVAAAAGVALTMSLARTEPDELITAAATDVGGWNGVRYQGAVAAADGGRIRFDLTVTVDGATGTLSRDDGQATAELHRDATGTVFRANRTWWLYHHPTRADELANTWVADPLTETQEIEPILQLHPYALAGHVRPEEQQAPWTAVEEQHVNGEEGVVLSDGTRQVVVAGAAPHPLLAVDIGPQGEFPPVQVSEVPGEEAAAAGRTAGEIRGAEAPKTLTQRLLERPQVEITLEPEPLCVTPSCTVSVTVTNSGSLAARGRLEVSADGTLVATHPLEVQPGQVATFTATAPNPQFSTPGATGQILWESRAVDD